jgi:chromosome partitioning protein
MYSVVVHGTPASTIVQATELPGLDIAPSSIDLVGAEIELADADRREFRLRDAIEPLRGAYDYILVDVPPSLGFLTLNALTAADSVLVPLQCEYFALEGVSQLLATIERVRDTFNSQLEIEGVALTMYDDRMNLARQVAAEIRNYFGEMVYRTVIPRNVRLAEAPSFGKPILLYDIRSRGSEAYVQLAQEFVRRAEALTLEVG